MIRDSGQIIIKYFDEFARKYKYFLTINFKNNFSFSANNIKNQYPNQDSHKF